MAYFQLLLSFATIVCSFQATDAVHAGAFRLAVDVDPVIRNAPASVTLRLTYTGTEDVSIAPLVPERHLTINGSESWTPQTGDNRGRYLGIRKHVTLSPGESLEETIYLQEYFSEIPAGRAELTFILEIWPEGGDPRVPIRIEKAIPIIVTEDSDAAIDRRLGALIRRLENLTTAKEKAEIYHALSTVPQGNLVEQYLRGLSDHDLSNGVHDRLRDAIRRSMTDELSTGLVVDWLVAQGGRTDTALVESLADNRHLTNEQTRRLLSAKNPWIRLRIIEYFEGDHSGRAASLEQEAKDLLDELHRIQEQKNNAPAPPGAKLDQNVPEVAKQIADLDVTADVRN